MRTYERRCLCSHVLYFILSPTKSVLHSFHLKRNGRCIVSLVEQTYIHSNRENMEEINSMGFEDFTEKMRNIVEHFPVLAGGLWSVRPFRDPEHLHQCLTRIMDDMPFALKEGVLRVHPDLAGRLAQEGLLTNQSTAEQKSAGLDSMSADERATLTGLNHQYKEKFGFPFVICARENKKAAILRGIQARLGNSLEQEVLQGVEEVKKISYYRILDIVESVTPSKL